VSIGVFCLQDSYESSVFIYTLKPKRSWKLNIIVEKVYVVKYVTFVHACLVFTYNNNNHLTAVCPGQLG